MSDEYVRIYESTVSVTKVRERVKRKRREISDKVKRARAHTRLVEWATYYAHDSGGLVRSRPPSDENNALVSQGYDDGMTDYLSRVYEVNGWADRLPVHQRLIVQLEYEGKFSPRRAQIWALRYGRLPSSYAKTLQRLKDDLAKELT